MKRYVLGVLFWCMVGLLLPSCITEATKFHAQQELETKKLEYELNQFKFQMVECRKMCRNKVRSFSIQTGECECFIPKSKKKIR